MSANENGSQSALARKCRFADCEFDEWSRQLIVKGKLATLETKPIEVLEQLLTAPGKTIRKDSLKDAVWGAETVDESLTTAIFKLRNAIGGSRESVIQTVHGVGYRFIAPVEFVESEPPGAVRLKLRKDEPVPGYADGRWRLSEPLDRARDHMVWLARHSETHEVHVFKFAPDEKSCDLLRRELAVFRLLRRRFGQAAPTVVIHACRLDKAPYFLESEYGGPDLRQWAEKQAPLESISMPQRLELAASVADALGAVHQAGILHNNLRPEHILISPLGGSNQGWRIRLSDFAPATLAEGSHSEPSASAEVEEDDQADLQLLSDSSQQVNAYLRARAARETTYFADELRSGEVAPSYLTDIYSLGGHLISAFMWRSE